MKNRSREPARKSQPRPPANRKKQPRPAPGADPAAAPSFLRKNEFALILFGALLLTLIVFFIFFRADGSAPEKAVPQAPSFDQLEKRIQALEQGLALKQEPVSGKPLAARIGRVETALSLKMDALAEQVEKLESRLAAMEKAPRPAKASPPVVPVKKPAVKKPAATAKTPKAPMFHTVKKGETLYSIGKKYNISVSRLRTLNKLSEKTDIYPGTNLLVR